MSQDLQSEFNALADRLKRAAKFFRSRAIDKYSELPNGVFQFREEKFDIARIMFQAAFTCRTSIDEFLKGFSKGERILDVDNQLLHPKMRVRTYIGSDDYYPSEYKDFELKDILDAAWEVVFEGRLNVIVNKYFESAESLDALPNDEKEFVMAARAFLEFKDKWVESGKYEELHYTNTVYFSKKRQEIEAKLCGQSVTLEQQQSQKKAQFLRKLLEQEPTDQQEQRGHGGRS